MKHKEWLLSILVYPVFFAAIGVGCLVEGSAWPLLALFLTPEIKLKDKSDE